MSEDKLAQEIENLIQLIDKADTTNLLKLAEIGGLNPAKDLAGGYLPKSDLKNANLSEVDLAETVLSETDFSKSQLSGAVNLKDAILTKANFREAWQKKGDLSGANLNEANLSLADLIGFNLEGATLKKANLFRTKLICANLKGANLSGANLSEADLSGANLENADLRGANLIGANLTQAKLRKADLSEAKLDSANLSDAYLNHANLSKATLQIANIKNAKLRSADLSYSDLRGAYLSGANLSGANLENAYLAGAIMMGVNFTLTNFSNSTLVGANLSNGIFIYADLTQARLNEATPGKSKFIECDGITEDIRKDLENKGADFNPIKITTIDFIDTKCSNNKEDCLIENMKYYCQLVTFEELLSKDIQNSPEKIKKSKENLRNIFELAKEDDKFESLIENVDELVAYKRRINKVSGWDTIASSILLDDFLKKIEQIKPDEMTAEKFKHYVETLKLSNGFLKPYIAKLPEQKEVQIVQTEVCSIRIMDWQPGDSSGKHPHGDILDVIRVHQGTLTHYLYSKDDPNILVEEEKRNFKAGEEVFIDRFQEHDMKNESEKNLITLHFRFGIHKEKENKHTPGFDKDQPVITSLSDSILTLERALERSAFTY